MLYGLLIILILFLMQQKVNFFGDQGVVIWEDKIVSESPRPKEIDYPINLEPISEFYKLEGLEKRNIQISSLKIPKNRIVTITGESGCGKSTLVKDCIAPYFEKKYKKIAFNLIGQDRNQSITSKSIIASFLMLKKKIR